MDDVFIPIRRSRRNAQNFTNLHYYQYELFNTITDLQVQEQNNHFTKVDQSCFFM